MCVLQCPAPKHLHRAAIGTQSPQGHIRGNYCLPVSTHCKTRFWRTWPAGGGKAATSGISCFPRHPCWRCFFPRLAAHDGMAAVCVAATQRCAAALLVTHSCASQGASGQYGRRLQHILRQQRGIRRMPHVDQQLCQPPAHVKRKLLSVCQEHFVVGQKAPPLARLASCGRRVRWNCALGREPEWCVSPECPGSRSVECSRWTPAGKNPREREYAGRKADVRETHCQVVGLSSRQATNCRAHSNWTHAHRALRK